MSDQLSDAYWASLGENGPFLQSLLESQQQQLQHLLTHFDNFQNNLANAASTAAVAAAQHIVIPTSPNISSTCSIKAADPERFTGDRTETEGFICAIKLAIVIQPGSFPDEQTKILYALSFMTGGSAHTWAQNETETIITNASTTDSLEEFLNCLEKAFGDPDHARTAHTRLHDLKMTPSMSTDDYTAQFEMLSG